MPRVTPVLADKVGAISARLTDERNRTGSETPVDPEVTTTQFLQSSPSETSTSETSPSENSQAGSPASGDRLPGIDHAGAGQLGPTGRPLPDFPEPPPLSSHGPARIIA